MEVLNIFSILDFCNKISLQEFQVQRPGGEGFKRWRKANATCFFKEGKEEDPDNYRLVSLTSIHGKVTEQYIVEAICRHIKDEKITKSSQHGLTEGKSCLTNLINFCDKMTGLADIVQCTLVRLLTLSRQDTHGTLQTYGLDMQTVRLTGKFEKYCIIVVNVTTVQSLSVEVK
ncbi:RNA-directed DNA polymerase from mobile element jockey-like protein [Willisornis vidua]|uniref:RNA-directed DNA polymerase from mobile element jockey-like protein n=1 Tax=Willisornis vidua TaxID=1566151 RepID=A0ABQ9CP66_9PASS|nr:RNA-directed DNA polymerase from mobile element jockey-like protein [Willisornis vidua]